MGLSGVGSGCGACETLGGGGSRMLFDVRGDDTVKTENLRAGLGMLGRRNHGMVQRAHWASTCSG